MGERKRQDTEGGKLGKGGCLWRKKSEWEDFRQQKKEKRDTYSLENESNKK
jgi:hypothetical protein